MLEKKRQEKIKTAVELEKTVAEILVANGRAIEPFVKVFNYRSENVTKSSLGTLVGVFEIAERSEDSAYIVNFLASVAKKEYFVNPRRSAIESFETALHKINLALAELVKHGNVAWLGKFHGALGVLDKNSLHFSVTGQAEILLLRNKEFSNISAGLASEESHVHPIKTFVEVSSGRLSPQDRIILTSPELLTLLSIADLEKNALRMDRDHFGQFLRTVLVNELDMAGAIVIDFTESASVPTPKKQEEKTEETTQNVFSRNAFSPKSKPAERDSFQDDKTKEISASEEYVDSKTGHIYVQGDTLGNSDTSQNIERAKLSLQNMLHGLGVYFASQEKILRKGKKYSSFLAAEMVKTSAVALRKITRYLRKRVRRILFSKPSMTPPRAPLHQADQMMISSPSEPKLPITRQTEPAPSRKEEKADIPDSQNRHDSGEIPAFMRAKLDAFYKKHPVPETVISTESFPKNDLIAVTSKVHSRLRKISQSVSVLFSSSKKRLFQATRMHGGNILHLLRNLPPQKRKMVFLGSVACVSLLALIIFLSWRFASNHPALVADIPKQETTTPEFPLATEKNARVLESPTTLSTQADPIVASLLLNDATYLITEKNIISVSDQKQYPLPGSGSIRLAAPMDNLSLIFISTDIGELFAWSPISRTFVKNTLTLPEGARITDIGAYLTYLYVLDSATHQIYRFPRAEGGFGQSLAWLKDNVTIEDTAKMAVNETIFLTPNKSTVQAFFRGRFVKNLESPGAPLSITSLFSHPGLANVYALDAQNKRIVVWNQDGALIAQYFSDKLADVKTITVNEKTGEILLTTSKTLISAKLDN